MSKLFAGKARLLVGDTVEIDDEMGTLFTLKVNRIRRHIIFGNFVEVTLKQVRPGKRPLIGHMIDSIELAFDE